MRGFHKGVFFLVIASLVVVCGSCARKSDAGADRSESADSAVTEAFSGLVTFVTGSVTVVSPDSERALDVGMTVSAGDVVKTGPDATCEIQFGHFGSVHLVSETSLDISRLSQDAGITKSELILGAGTVICKVRKLSGDDSFVIRTSTLVCGVRGTLFLVSHEEGKTTKIAVETGRVAVAPRTGTVDATDALPDATSLLVEAGFESVVRAESLGEAAVELSAPSPIAEDTKAVFAGAPTLDIRDLAPPQDDQSSNAAPVSFPVVRVIAEPATAEVAINGKTVSRGQFTGIFSEGETVRLTISEKGFAVHEEDLVMIGGTEIVRVVALKRTDAARADDAKTDDAKTDDSKASPSAKPVSEEASQETFVVPVSGKKIMFAVADNSGKTLVSDEGAVLYCLDAKGKVTWTADTGNGQNVNSAPVLEGAYAAYAGDKTLAVYDSTRGTRLWTLPLDASSSALFGRKPAISGGKVFLSTGSGISAFTAATGAPAGVVAIPDGTEMTPACRGDSLYVVSRSGLFVEIDIPTLSIKRKVATGSIQPIATKVALAGNLAVFGDRKGTVTAVDLAEFSVRWQRKLSEERSAEVYGEIAVSRDLAFVVARDTLHVLSLANGMPVGAPVAGVVSPVRVTPGAMWCALSSRKVLGFSGLDGSRVGEYPVPGMVSSGVAYNGDRLVAPLADGKAAFIALK